jgi:tetratricopeptide (TPR) repeat protein
MKPFWSAFQLRPIGICFVFLVLFFSSLLTGCRVFGPSDTLPSFALSDDQARQAGALALYSKALLLESGEGSANTITNTAKEAALEAYRHAVRLDPDNRRPLAAMVLNLAERERYGDALAALETYLARHPDDIGLRLEAARIADAADRPKDAARHCERIFASQTDNRELAQALIRLLFQAGQDAKALRLMRSQHERFHDGDSAALPVQWAVHFAREGKQPARTLACLELALPLRTNATERAALITLTADSQLGLGQTNAAIASLHRAYRECPSLTAPILRLGALWATRPGSTNQLARQAREEKAPEATLLILAATQQALDNPTAAAATLKDVYARQMCAGYFPDESFYVWLGSLLEESKESSGAESLFREALTAYPSSHEIKNFLAYMWAEKGQRLDEADRLINDALLAVPDNGAYLDTKGWVLFKKARYFDALQFLLAAAERDKDEPVILDHVGDALLAIGRDSEAVAFWTRSHQLDPVPSVADKLRKHGADPTRK